MKITYLGTAAFEGTPAMYCNCKVCAYAREKGGRNIRTRTQALIDESLLIDYPPDTYVHAAYGALDMRKVENIIITHSHSDHFYPGDISHNRFPAAISEKYNIINLFGNERTIEKVRAFHGDEKGINFKYTVIHPFDTFSAGRYTVTAIEAVHDRNEECLLYIVFDGEKRLLYGNDTGFLTEKDMEFIKDMKFDLISLDCTQGIHRDGNNHMGYEDVIEMFGRFQKNGNLTDKTVKVAQHFSHYGELSYDKYCEIFKDYGIIPTYDGMEIDF